MPNPGIRIHIWFHYKEKISGVNGTVSSMLIKHAPEFAAPHDPYISTIRMTLQICAS